MNLSFFCLFSIYPLFNTETRFKNGAEDASSHLTHPREPAWKKKSVAKAKNIFSSDRTRSELRQLASLPTVLFLIRRLSVVAHLFDRSDWSVAVGLGKSFGWVAARPQPKRRINCENPFACEKLHFAISQGLLPLYHTQNTHENAKLNLSRLPRMGANRGCGTHYSASG